MNKNQDFKDACRTGNLDLARKIYFKCNIDISDTENFINVCANGNLALAQWILQVNSTINIYAWNESKFAFHLTCIYGHLEVAQWLLQIKPDINISVKNEYAFRYTCSRRHLEVAQWLHTIRPYHYILEIKDNQIIKYGVRPLKERKWLERKLILLSHTLERTNKLYNLPHDLVRHIVAFV